MVSRHDVDAVVGGVAAVAMAMTFMRTSLRLLVKRLEL